MVPAQRAPHSSQARLIRYGAVTLAVGLCLAAAVAIWGLIGGSFDATSLRVLLSGVAAVPCTLGGLAGATALRLGSAKRRVGQVTVGLSQLTLLLVLALIWIPDSTGSDGLPRTVGVAGVLMLAGAHASLLLARARPGDTRAVRWLTRSAILCAGSAAFLLSGMIAAGDPGGVGIARLLGVLVVVALLNTALTPLARRIAPQTGRSIGRWPTTDDTAQVTASKPPVPHSADADEPDSAPPSGPLTPAIGMQ